MDYTTENYSDLRKNKDLHNELNYCASINQTYNWAAHPSISFMPTSK
jgi:hypothetical protein